MTARTPEQRRRYAATYAANNPKKVRELKRLSAARWYSRNKKLQRERVKDWQSNNREQMRAIWRNGNALQKYGITTAERDAMFLAQGSVCAACGADQPGSKLGWHIDHCHATFKVRGILCHHCNSAAGHAKDDPIKLRQIAKYLEKHKK
jgi:hypothetical protein